jgi:hypothetical protein
LGEFALLGMKFVHQLFVVKSLSPYIISSEAKLQMHGYNVACTLTGGGFIQLQKKDMQRIREDEEKEWEEDRQHYYY